MVVDLADAAATATKLQFGVYRTAALADKIIRYLQWRSTGGATTDTLHCIVSAGKEHLFITVEGPRAGEVNPFDANYGSHRPAFFLCDLLPYFTADTVPAVVCGGPTNAGVPSSASAVTVHVSRNAANAASWVPALLETLQAGRGAPSQTPARYGGQSLSASALVVRPYVVFEDAAGMRGRLSSIFNMGWNAAAGSGDVAAQTFSRITVGSATYVGLVVNKRIASTVTQSPFAETGPNTDAEFTSPVIAVPYS